MPELLRKQVLRQSLGVWPRIWPLAWAVPLAVLPVLVQAADQLPASVRACAAVTDVLQRLACYDREVARYPAPTAKSSASAQPAAPTSQSAPVAQNSPAPQAAAKVSAPPAASDTNAAESAVPPTASGATAAAPAAGKAAASESQQVLAHVVSIERVPNEMILHLDNGQVWQEVQSVPGDLSLREGDAIKIDRHFGSYWLSGPHVSSMKVRQKS
jgi:hypothetical protein